VAAQAGFKRLRRRSIAIAGSFDELDLEQGGSVRGERPDDLGSNEHPRKLTVLNASGWDELQIL
jgi:hypothetical protein